MAIAHATVSVGTDATQVSSATDSVRELGDYAHTVLIQNPTGGVSVFLGGPGVTDSAYGYELAAGSSISVDVQSEDVLYAVVSADTQDVYCLYQGV